MVDDPELIELVEMEVTEQLEEYDFTDCPIIKGSALKALEDPMGEWGDKIMELMDTVDEYIPDPQRETDKPFLVELKEVRLRLVKKLKSLVSKKRLRNPLLPVSRCSVNYWMRHRLVITSVFCFVVSREPISSVDRFWLNPVLLPATENSPLRFTF